MRAVVSTSLLRHALELAKSVTPSNPALLAHAAVRLQVGDELTVQATDGDTTVVARVPLVDGDTGEALVLGRPLLQLLTSTMPSEVTLESNGSQLSVAGLSKRPYRFPQLGVTVDPAQFPDKGADEPRLQNLSAAVASVRHAAGRDTAAVKISAEGGKFTIAATDSYRLAVATFDADLGAWSTVVPVATLERIARQSPSTLSCTDDGSKLRFDADAVSWVTRPLAVPFPNIERVVSAKPSTTLKLNRGETARALQRLAAVDQTGDAVLNVAAASGELVLSIESGPGGDGAEVVAVDTDAEIAFTIRRGYLLDALAAHVSDPVCLGHDGGVQPVHVSSHGDGLEVTTVVMPLRTGA